MIPTNKQISPTNGQSLDEREALEHFLGLDVKDARKLFFENPLYYSSDLIWMGLPAFRYYFPAFAEYLRSEASLMDADALNSLTSTLAFRIDSLEGERSELAKDECVRDTVKYCLREFDRFDADEIFYPDLKSELSRVLDVLESNCSNNP
jgi:hypothetical protein